MCFIYSLAHFIIYSFFPFFVCSFLSCVANRFKHDSHLGSHFDDVSAFLCSMNMRQGCPLASLRGQKHDSKLLHVVSILKKKSCSEEIEPRNDVPKQAAIPVQSPSTSRRVPARQRAALLKAASTLVARICLCLPTSFTAEQPFIRMISVASNIMSVSAMLGKMR